MTEAQSKTVIEARSNSNKAIALWEDGLYNLSEARLAIASHWIVVTNICNEDMTDLMCNYLDILETLSEL